MQLLATNWVLATVMLIHELIQLGLEASSSETAAIVQIESNLEPASEGQSYSLY